MKPDKYKHPDTLLVSCENCGNAEKVAWSVVSAWIRTHADKCPCHRRPSKLG